MDNSMLVQALFEVGKTLDHLRFKDVLSFSLGRCSNDGVGVFHLCMS